MRSSFPLLLYQCAILLVSPDGIVCPVVIFDFVIENFSTADIYSHVKFCGSNETGAFILNKGARNTDDGGRRLEIPIPSILRHTLKQEDNCPKIASFSLRGVNVSANFNIKFRSEEQAHYFVTRKAVPERFKVVWARIYSNWRPVIMAYDYMDGYHDVGFKLVDNDGNHPDIEGRFEKLPHLFRRSEIHNEIRTTPPSTLYLRNKARAEDYEIVFQSIVDLCTFLELFPERRYNEDRTSYYYFVPPTEYKRRSKLLASEDTSEPRGLSESADMSESRDTAELRDPSEPHDKSDLSEASE